MDEQSQRPQVISLTHRQTESDAPQPSRKLPKINLKRYVGRRSATFLIASVIVIVGVGIFLWPRAQTVTFASSTRESLSKSFTELDSVDASLNALFKFATASSDDVQLSRLTNTFKKMDSIFAQIAKKEDEESRNEIGIRVNELVEELSNVFESLQFSERGKVSFGGKIKGFTTPADDPNKIYRDQRDLATKVHNSVEDSEKELGELEKNLGKGFSPTLSSLKEELKSLKSKTKDYLAESEKTADYYVLISDLSIELEGSFDSFQISLEATSDINSLVATFDEISKELKGLKVELEGVGSGSLPAEIGDLHNDSIELFDVVIKYFDSLKVLTLNEDQKGIVDLTADTSVKLNQLVLKGADDEISFWKNNKTLNSYDSLSGEYTETLKKLEETIEKNDFFLF